MFDFGDELTVESNKIPWLIWVQVLVMLLLILLLYCFTIISLDPIHNKDSSSSSFPSSSSQLVSDFNTHIASTVVTNRLQNTQVRYSFLFFDLLGWICNFGSLSRVENNQEDKGSNLVSCFGISVKKLFIKFVWICCFMYLWTTS